MSNPRRANGHRRDAVRRRVLAEEDNCWICGLWVDKDLKTPHPGSPEVDEVIPVSKGGDPFARANCRLAHRWPVQHPSRQRRQAARGDRAAADLEELVNGGRRGTRTSPPQPPPGTGLLHTSDPIHRPETVYTHTQPRGKKARGEEPASPRCESFADLGPTPTLLEVAA